jgi:hypothetical protein
MKTMAEVGSNYDLLFNEDGKVKYQIRIPEGDYLFLTISAFYGSPAFNFNHKNILHSENKIMEFKTYLSNGGKRWTQKAGKDFLFAIKKDKIYMVEEEGYSYVKVIINGEKYSLNVNGGTNGSCWVDFVSQGSHVGVTKKKSNIQKLAESAFIPEDFKPIEHKEMDEDKQKRFNELCAYIDTMGKLKVGSKILLKQGYHVNGSRGSFEVIKKPARSKSVVCSAFSSPCRVTYSKIDWIETAAIN